MAEVEIPFESKEARRELIVAHRERLADLLSTLDDDQWDHPTLCKGWSVRHVVGHLLTPSLQKPSKTLATVVKRGGFTRGFDHIAKEIGAKPPEELIRLTRSYADVVWSPPSMGISAPLTDILVHSQDIARPLGIDLPVAAEHVDPALTFCVSPKSNQIFTPPSRYRRIRLIATDIKWRCGKGPIVEGPALALLLALTGRASALVELEGEGVDRLARRIS